MNDGMVSRQGKVVNNMSKKKDKLQTFTHEVKINGEVAFSTQLPVGYDPAEYDADASEFSELVEAEASHGARGAFKSLAIAIKLSRLPGWTDKPYKSICQEDVYKDLTTWAYSKHNKSPSAYSHKRTEKRENKGELKELIKSLGVKGGELDALTDKWWLDPKRDKSKGGGRKKTGEKEVSFTANTTVDVPADDDDEDAGDANLNMNGQMAALTAKFRRITKEDTEPNPVECLNNLRALIRAAQGAEQFVKSMLQVNAAN